MSSNKKFLFSLLLAGHIFLGKNIYPATKLPPLLTKQSVQNLCFLSGNDLFTYYQNRSGGLFLSTNYKITQLMQGSFETIYSVHASPTRKKMVVEMDPLYFTRNQITHHNGLFLMDFGGTKLKKIGEGTYPRLHLKDTWVSYYQPQIKTLYFFSLIHFDLNFQIRLNNPINSYFVPEVVMVNDQTVYFTDLNKEGFEAVMEFNRNGQKISPLFKTPVRGVKIEICMKENNLFMGQFAYPDIIFGSEISLVPTNPKVDFTKRKGLYKSLKNDLGNMECQNPDKLIYFVQDQSPSKTRATVKSEVVSLHTETGELLTVSDLLYATQVINIDGRIVVPFRGELFVIKGTSSTNLDNLQKFELNKIEGDE